MAYHNYYQRHQKSREKQRKREEGLDVFTKKKWGLFFFSQQKHYQYTKKAPRDFLKTEDIKLEFTDEAVREIAHMSATVNTRTENIGARRLQTIIEKLLEDISFDAPDLSGQTIILGIEKVREKLDNIIQDDDLSRYIL